MTTQELLEHIDQVIEEETVLLDKWYVEALEEQLSQCGFIVVVIES